MPSHLSFKNLKEDKTEYSKKNEIYDEKFEKNQNKILENVLTINFHNSHNLNEKFKNSIYHL